VLSRPGWNWSTSAAVVKELGHLYGHKICVCAGIYEEYRNSNVQAGNILCCFMSVCRTLREERKLSVFENRVLRGLLGHKDERARGD
jgi:hypothetical protein